jgi:hypothetical protein
MVLMPSAIATLPAKAIRLLEPCGRPAPFEQCGVADAREHRPRLNELGTLGMRQVRAQHDLPAVRCVHAQYTLRLVQAAGQETLHVYIVEARVQVQCY